MFFPDIFSTRCGVIISNKAETKSSLETIAKVGLLFVVDREGVYRTVKNIPLCIVFCVCFSLATGFSLGVGL